MPTMQFWGPFLTFNKKYSTILFNNKSVRNIQQLTDALTYTPNPPFLPALSLRKKMYPIISTVWDPWFGPNHVSDNNITWISLSKTISRDSWNPLNIDLIFKDQFSFRSLNFCGKKVKLSISTEKLGDTIWPNQRNKLF